MNAYGDYSCDLCHKLYNHDGLIQDYAKLVKENQRLKVNARFHGLHSDAMHNALAEERKRAAALERELGEYLPY